MSQPTDIALALGLAAIGRDVLVVRPDVEKPVELARAVLDELTDHGGEGFGPYNRHAKRMLNEHSGGRVFFVNREQVRRRELDGFEFHHAFGLQHLTDVQEQYARSRVRKEVLS